MKIDKRKKYFIVLDVETCNNHMESKNNDGLVYDLGFGVYDKNGKEYEAYSIVVTDIFFGERDLMQSAYYANKLPQYYEDIKDRYRDVLTIFQARRLIKETAEKYGITEFYAYNANFDLTTLNNTVRYISKSLVRYFLPYGAKMLDIWHCACQVLCTQKTFQKQNIRNANGNLITNAERVFAYISGNDNFKESHTGLEDVRIECQILVKCFRQHKKMDKSINRQCWKIPNVKVA